MPNEPLKEVKKAAPRRRPAPAKPADDASVMMAQTMAMMMEGMKGMTQMLSVISEKLDKPAPAPITPEAAKKEKEIAAAAPDVSIVNPAWVAKAQEIIGDAVDHCEVFYPKHGGTLFTVVIKEESSNANTDYIERYKADRRTKEIGNEGIEGVEQWCKLISQNLKRGKQQ